MKILVTGSAGFIGSRLIEFLVENGNEVVGIDNINNYYDPNLKIARLQKTGIEVPEGTPLEKTTPCAGYDIHEILFPNIVYGKEIESSLYPNYKFIKLDITDKPGLESLFEREKFDIVVNLAAQAGVRYSIQNPQAYVQSNIVGFVNILEAIRQYPVKHFVYASSSSVYGGNTKVPFSEDDAVDNQVSMYAATKRSNELIANVYANLYQIPSTGLRFFTVYGPWGRPDMAPILFTRAILDGEPIKVFNNGNMSRDFTYIDDIVEGVLRIIEHIPTKDVPAVIYNIGRGEPVPLMNFIRILEKELGKKAIISFKPMQSGDVYSTYADTKKLHHKTIYTPQVPLDLGVKNFVKWIKKFTWNQL